MIKASSAFIYIILVALLQSATSAYGQSAVKTPEQFQQEMDKAGLVFNMPEKYHVIPVNEKSELWYGFAIRHDTADFEVRYSYWTLEEELARYRECKLDSSCTMEHPNRTYRIRIEEQLKKITGGSDLIMTNFPPTAVKEIMHADAGGFSFFLINNEFGKGYAIAQAVVFHKDDVADILITYLSNNRELHEKLLHEPFDAIKFKP